MIRCKLIVCIKLHAIIMNVLTCSPYNCYFNTKINYIRNEASLIISFKKYSTYFNQVASLACEGFALLLNSYEYISDTGWKKLHHLLIEPASPSPSIKVFRPLTISLGPFAFKEPQTTDLKLNTLGSVALDWCLGFMSPLGRQKIEEQNLDVSYALLLRF